MPIAASLAAWASWQTVFLIAALMNATAAILALALLKPMRRRMMVKA